MYPIFQIASKEKTLHSYQFSYDVEDGVYENPVQTILQAFVKKDIIDCSSGFTLIRGGKVLDEAIVVRPVRTTWLFLSKKTLDEIVDFLASALDDQVKYTISEMTLQDNGFLFYFREADINSIDKELAEAIDAVSAESAAARVRYKDVLDFLHAKIDKVAKGLKVILLLLAMSFGFTTNAWAGKIDNTNYGKIKGSFNGWSEWDLTRDGSTDHYYGTFYVPTSNDNYQIKYVLGKFVDGGSGWRNEYSFGGWWINSNNPFVGDFGINKDNDQVVNVEASSGFQKWQVDIWGEYSNQNAVKIVRTAVAPLSGDMYPTSNSVSSGSSLNMNPSISGGSGSYNKQYFASPNIGSFDGDNYKAPMVLSNTSVTITLEVSDANGQLSGLAHKTITKTITVTPPTGDLYIKHPWSTGADNAWSWQKMTKVSNGNYKFSGNYGGDGKSCDINTKADDEGKLNINGSNLIVNNSPALNDKCWFTLSYFAGTITIAPKTYTLTLDGNGGTQTLNSAIATYGKTINIKSLDGYTDPQKTGYSYGGYGYKNNNNNLTQVILEGGGFKSNVTNWTTQSTNLWIHDEDAILYAMWNERMTTVTINHDGNGTVSSTEVSVGVETTQSVTATPKLGYYFVNWTVGGNADIKNATTDNPVTLYGNGSAGTGTLTANFAAYQSTLSVTESVNVGKMATVTFNKDSHYNNPTITYELWNEGKTAKVEDGTTFNPTQAGATFIAQVAETYTVRAIVEQNSTIVDEIFSNAFTINPVYTVNFAVSPTEKGCTVTPATPKENVTLNEAFAISATAGTGYHFNKWIAVPENTFTFEDATSASTQVTMTAAAVTSTITATFSPNAYVVRFNANSPTGQKATGTMEDQSFEYDEAAKALTENAFVRLGYTFLGWATTADGAKEYDDKQAVQNLATESGAVVNLYAVWQLKTDCSITVTQPAAEDGTIAPSTKVTGANVEGTTYTYTFNPKDNSVTFMNWTITNAICVEGTNERSNPVKIKTYGEATVRANVKENLVSVTLKVLPNDQWGYFNVNGNNVASGTVINVGSKTDAKVFAYTNFGYAFTDPKFEWSEDISTLIDFNESTGVMKGKGNVGKVTLIAKYKVDVTTNWKISGNIAGEQASWSSVTFAKHSDQNTKKIAYATVHLTPQGSAFELQLDKSGTRYGNTGTLNENNYRFGWTFTTPTTYGKNCKFWPPQEGDYVFRLDYNDENKPTLTVLMPTDQHYFPEGTTIYFNDHNENNWGRSIIRFGCDGGIAEAYDMPLVPGTANLHSYTFPEGYHYFDVYQIANNYGWTGAKDKTKETTYGIRNIGEGDYKIGRATDDLTDGAATGYVIRIQTNHSKGDYEVEYYRCNTWDSRDASKYTVNFTAPNAEQGTLTVEQWENKDGSARTTLSSGDKVDQTRWITITATPKPGYKFVKMTAKMSGRNAEDHTESTWAYVVADDVESITAEFAPVNTYTFYVKNVDASDTKWHNGGTKDVYLYYDNGGSGDKKVSYWGWPGLITTAMDNNHEWYKVEMTNAYFDIQHWRLNNGVGADCPQTEQYVTQNGVPVFINEPMEGKYYELVYKESGTYEYETYQLQEASTTPSFYRVITADGKYTSNVAKVGEIVSFFATTAGAKLQKSSASGWTDVTNGSISIDANNVYVATIGADNVSDLKPYEGNYYIRTDGASGKWGEYKDPSKNNAMTYFTPRQGETYSYYWVKNLGKGSKINVKAKVANDFNDNLAGEITNDANTDIYGDVAGSTNGSNVRFSYEPTTNAFERAILSGSAEDSYLNIVGANIYSDESCKSEFALNENTYKTNPKACKLRDISDWVYEMTIYANVPNTYTAIGVDMYSLYNGNRSTLLDNKVIMAKGTGAATYKLRVTYDFKKNRITTSWSPSSQMITETMTVNADIQFLQNEKGDVSQITIKQDEEESVTVKSLEYLLYVLEIEDPGEDKRGEEHYRISLPFDCRVSDIYGIEGYVELNDAGQPISGNWGIQEYDGKTRAKQGWYADSPIQNFWRWLRKDEVMHAGQGYSISIDKSALKWSTIGEEVTRTICDANGTNCQDVTTTEDRAAHRLYFPSTNPGFDLANSTTDPTTYEAITCTKTQANRDIYDSDWRFMGSTAYNNIKTNNVTNERAGDKAVPEYLYVLNAQETEYVPVTTTAAAGFIFRSFGAYMFQFHGTIAWNIYTQSHPEVVSAPRYSATQHAPLKMHVDVMEGEEMAAQAFVELNDQATTGFDQKMDLTFMKSSKVARAFTTTEGIDYAANCLPFESTIVPMTVNTLHAGDYTLHLEGADNVAVYLIDYQLQTETLISAGDVEVELGKGSSSDRFALRFDVAASPTDSKNAKGETIINDGQKTQKLLINDNIYLINAGRIYNATGTNLR